MQPYINIIKRTVTLLLVSGMWSLSYTVLAHDAWVEPKVGTNTFKILYGHKIPESYSFLKVTTLTVVNAQQKPLEYSRIESTDGLSIKVMAGKPAMFALEYDNGYWVKVGTESRNMRKSELPEGTDPAHPIKYSKTILSWQPWMNKPVGHRIEFIPVNFVGAPKAGAKLKLQLLLDGKPLADQMVENNSNEKGPKTDINGMVTVTVLKGINRFATDHNISQPTEPDALRLSLTAALVFVAK